MKVSELIEELKQLPQDHIVVLSRDAEGNGYSALDSNGVCYGNMKYHEGDSEIGLAKLDQESIDAGYDEEDVLEGGEPCIVLYP